MRPSHFPFKPAGHHARTEAIYAERNDARRAAHAIGGRPTPSEWAGYQARVLKVAARAELQHRAWTAAGKLLQPSLHLFSWEWQSDQPIRVSPWFHVACA